MDAHQRRLKRRKEIREGRGKATLRTEDGRVIELEANTKWPSSWGPNTCELQIRRAKQFTIRGQMCEQYTPGPGLAAAMRELNPQMNITTPIPEIVTADPGPMARLLCEILRLGSDPFAL